MKFGLACLLVLGSVALGLAAPAPQGFGSFEDYSLERIPYSFSWAVSEEDSQENDLHFGHQESRSEESDLTQGSYYVQLPDTRLMRVEYYVDSTGYHPTITFEGEAVFPDSFEYDG